MQVNTKEIQMTTTKAALLRVNLHLDIETLAILVLHYR